MIAVERPLCTAGNECAMNRIGFAAGRGAVMGVSQRDYPSAHPLEAREARVYRPALRKEPQAGDVGEWLKPVPC